MGVEVLIPDFNGEDGAAADRHGGRGRTSSTTTSRRSSASRSRSASAPAGIAASASSSRPRRGARDRQRGPHEEPASWSASARRATNCQQTFRGAARGRLRHPHDRPVPAADAATTCPSIRYFHPDEFAEMKVEALGARASGTSSPGRSSVRAITPATRSRAPSCKRPAARPRSTPKAGSSPPPADAGAREAARSPGPSRTTSVTETEVAFATTRVAARRRRLPPLLVGVGPRPAAGRRGRQAVGGARTGGVAGASRALGGHRGRRGLRGHVRRRASPGPDVDAHRQRRPVAPRLPRTAAPWLVGDQRGHGDARDQHVRVGELERVGPVEPASPIVPGAASIRDPQPSGTDCTSVPTLPAAPTVLGITVPATMSTDFSVAGWLSIRPVGGAARRGARPDRHAGPE